MPPKKILVVDDEPEVRKLMEHFLTGKGFEVRVAENGRLGLATLETFMPDLVLLDMHMPELDGAGTLREVARRWPTLPVIMVTVNEDVETTSRLASSASAREAKLPWRRLTCPARVGSVATRAS